MGRLIVESIGTSSAVKGGGKRYDDGLDVGSFQEIRAACARPRVVRIQFEVAVDGKALRGFQRPRVDRL